MNDMKEKKERKDQGEGGKRVIERKTVTGTIIGEQTYRVVSLKGGTRAVKSLV